MGGLLDGFKRNGPNEEQKTNICEARKLQIFGNDDNRLSVKEEVTFLQSVGSHPCLYDDNVIKRALQRYKHHLL